MENTVTKDWFKSSLSTGENNCVEARFHEGGVDIRNSKNPGAGTATFTPDEWTAFVGGVKKDEFDLA